MILQALTRHYEDLLKRGDIEAPGWSLIPISFALCLDADGELTQAIPTTEEKKVGNKTVRLPINKPLPAAVKRSSGVAANFLWDNSAYLLGVDQKGKPERSRECFAAAAALHHAVLDGVDSPMARAILAFFDTWQPESAASHPALQDRLDDVTAGRNLVFWLDGYYPHEDDAIRAAWQRYYDAAGEEDLVRMQCLVTGRVDEIAAVHPSIKGVQGAQSSGAALVSFNAPAFCSYGREQNYNAPVGKSAAFAYTAALNHLLADRDNVHRIGDTTVVCWADGADPQFTGWINFITFGDEAPKQLRDNDLRSALKKIADAQYCDELDLDPDRPFYVLGLAPNAARLSVRFFLRDTFGNLMKNVNAHHERLEIAGAKYEFLPLWALLQETVNLKSNDKKPSPVVAGATTRAVFTGEPYPVSLLNAVLLRIRAEREITWGRAAILKAYLMRNIIGQRENDAVIKEVANVRLNEDCAYMPYVLGRLFCVMEQAQLASTDWSLNRTIKDSYFNAAASTPRNAFAKLFPLSEYHMKKLLRDKPGLGNKYNKLKAELTAKITTPIPARFTQEESICFYLGYYHQKENKKEEKENG